MLNLTINGKSHDVDVEPDTPLLWVIRELDRHDRNQVRLRHRAVWRVHGPYRRRRDAIVLGIQVSDAVGKKITTIEGLAQNGTSCTKCSRPGSTMTCRNAAIARAA